MEFEEFTLKKEVFDKFIKDYGNDLNNPEKILKENLKLVNPENEVISELQNIMELFDELKNLQITKLDLTKQKNRVEIEQFPKDEHFLDLVNMINETPMDFWRSHIDPEQINENNKQEIDLNQSENSNNQKQQQQKNINTNSSHASQIENDHSSKKGNASKNQKKQRRKKNQK